MSADGDVRTVDPDDDDAYAAWFAVVDASQQHLSPEPGDAAGELRAIARAARGADAPQHRVLLAAVQEGATVGAAALDLPLRDNLHLAHTELVHVHPAHRRQGAGTALLDALHAAAAAHGRRDLVLGLEEVGEDAGVLSPGRAFLAAAGFHEASVEVRRDLDLPADEGRLAALEAGCRPHTAGYALRTWEGVCPQDLVEDRALLGRRMSTDAPHGDLPVEEEDWDAARVRAREEVSRAAGRRVLAVGAVHEESGRMVAFTEIGLQAETPTRAFQWETLVLREHRGHRLGTWMKVANVRRAAQLWPGCRYVSTWNATTNAPMIAVNDALGCRVAGAWSDWQQPVRAAGAR